MNASEQVIVGIGSNPDSLKAITRAVDMTMPFELVEWSTESARLFALDCALVTMRRRIPWLSDAETTHLGVRLNEARRLAVAGREIELGFVSDEMVAFLANSRTHNARQVWIVALNAMLPDPFRAALIACESAIIVDHDAEPDSHPSIESRLRERFAARINESAIMMSPSPDLDAVTLVGA